MNVQTNLHLLIIGIHALNSFIHLFIFSHSLTPFLIPMHARLLFPFLLKQASMEYGSKFLMPKIRCMGTLTSTFTTYSNDFLQL